MEHLKKLNKTSKSNAFLKNSEVTMIIPIKASDFKYVEKLVPLAKKNINPKEIQIISAPEIKEKCTKLGVGFIDENKLIRNLSFNTLKQNFTELGIDAGVTGWYLQQFLKLGFARICKTKYYVSWDADMLPVRKINLFSNDGLPYFTLKKEYLKRYFTTIKRLFNIEKIRNESFIAEHMLFDCDLVKEMINEIETSNGKKAAFWKKILLATLPESYNDAFAFSEFETYGTWVETRHPHAYAIRKLNMFRHAKYYFGENISQKEISWAAKDFDTLSFEHFDTQIIPSLWVQQALSNTDFKNFLHTTYPLLDSKIQQRLSEFDWFWGGNKTCYEKTLEEEKDIYPAEKIKLIYDATLINNFDDKSKERTGIYWVSFNILKNLSLRKDVELYLFSSNMQKTKNFISHYAAEISGLNLFSGDIRKMDIFLSSSFNIQNEIKKTNIPCFTIIYDCIPLVLSEYFDIGKDWFIPLLKSFSPEDYCFSISDNTKKDFLKYCPWLDSQKITTIPLSTNLPYKPDKNLTKAVRRKYNIPLDKKYLFSLCSLEPRKNLIRAVKTFIQFIEEYKIDDLVFVLGGSAYDGFIEKFEKEVPNLAKYKNKIIRAGYVDDKDMEVLYSNAEWFVYTSQYEGFGMPPLEAMACGTAVITSNNSSLPEVVGDAGIMIDWDSDEQHVAAYEKYYFDKKYRAEMAEKGLKRSKLFSWEKAVDIMVEQFKKCPQNQKRDSLIFSEDSFLVAPKNNGYQTLIKLFGFIPLLKIRKNEDLFDLKIFGCLDIYKSKRVGGRITWKIFGFPVFKIRKMANGITNKYYIFGLNIFKKSHKPY